MQPTDVEDTARYGPPPQYRIESVDNALRLLLLFETQPNIRLTDASNYLGVASSTAHRLLGMLQYRGFVRQNPSTKAYEPGQALSSIAVSIRRQVDIRTLVHPVLERLFQSTGETVHFGKLEGTNTHFIDAIESARAVRVASRQGMTLPANCTATGKAILSRLPLEQLRKLYPAEELPGLTKGSITSMTELERALEVIRKTGYATSQEESEDGVTSAAVAVLSPGGACYGINVSVPAHRMTRQLRAELGAKLQEAAKEIEGLLV
ncbi:IclR family transcriptional regulator [Arthrobacter crystallopoietes]|uniref:DNA-binding transcriptional regulator, IclR family n=1 Tax=Crystallibacter crystallopoietes TaxID=37928 RepID=A0A1H1HV45_9MICC|nr:IclR family transcriptional regulator [Arthrobacter crystallopoietes]SDR29290.1 DNA-binding transcriptional regulator, IclR family [Arthrobacter crystallopoietes]